MFRKHASWYLTGFPVGGELRRRFSQVSTLAELDDLLAALDPTTTVVDGGERIRRGHTNGPIRVSLPDGFLDDPDDLTIPDDSDVLACRRLTAPDPQSAGWAMVYPVHQLVTPEGRSR